MSTTFIYALCEPDTGEVRYVGKANDPVERLQNHLRDAPKEKNHKANWVRSLLAAGFKPVLEILDEVSVEVWPQWEVAWIAFFREQGFSLTNATLGGEGIEGYAMTLEGLAKMGATKVGNKYWEGRRHSPEANEKNRVAHLGTTHTLEHRAKISASLIGNKYSLGKTPWNKGKKADPAAVAKMAAANLGRKHTPEACANMGASRKGKKRGPYKKKGQI